MATEATQGEELAAIVYVDRPPAEPEQPATTAVTASDAPKRRARLRVRHAVKKGQVIARLDIGGEGYVTTPKYTTVQVSRTTHLDLQSALVYMNHSCNPSVVLDTVAMTVVAARDLAADDELTFFYPSTEWSMAEPFDCWCGAERCLGRISGAADMPVAALARYYINAHIRELATECLNAQPLP